MHNCGFILIKCRLCRTRPDKYETCPEQGRRSRNQCDIQHTRYEIRINKQSRDSNGAVIKQIISKFSYHHQALNYDLRPGAFILLNVSVHPMFLFTVSISFWLGFPDFFCSNSLHQSFLLTLGHGLPSPRGAYFLHCPSPCMKCTQFSHISLVSVLLILNPFKM